MIGLVHCKLKTTKGVFVEKEKIKGTALEKKNNLPSVNHVRGNILLWGDAAISDAAQK